MTKDHILIIEDEAPIRRVMAMALEADYDVTVAEDGPSGLAKFGDGVTWQAVLLDQRLPGMEGLDVLRRMKGVNAAVPVVMITAYPSIDLAVDAMKFGATDFIKKPVTPEVLRTAVAAALHGSKPDHLPTRSRAKGVDIEMATLNGFRIVFDGQNPDDNSYRFRVASGGAPDFSVVTVVIEPSAEEQLRQHTDRRFDRRSAFWQALAESRLASYLWLEQHVPPLHILSVPEIDADSLIDAMFFPEDEDRRA